MFYHSDGICGAETEGCLIVFTFNFIGVGKGTVFFKFSAGNQLFLNVEIV